MATGRFMQSGSTCIMIGFRSDHACIMHKSETDWMHARGQPASARAWPAASGQLPGFHFASARVLEGDRKRTGARACMRDGTDLICALQFLFEYSCTMVRYLT